MRTFCKPTKEKKNLGSQILSQQSRSVETFAAHSETKYVG